MSFAENVKPLFREEDRASMDSAVVTIAAKTRLIFLDICSLQAHPCRTHQ